MGRQHWEQEPLGTGGSVDGGNGTSRASAATVGVAGARFTRVMAFQLRKSRLLLQCYLILSVCNMKGLDVLQVPFVLHSL